MTFDFFFIFSLTLYSAFLFLSNIFFVFQNYLALLTFTYGLFFRLFEHSAFLTIDPMSFGLMLWYRAINRLKIVEKSQSDDMSTSEDPVTILGPFYSPFYFWHFLFSTFFTLTLLRVSPFLIWLNDFRPFVPDSSTDIIFGFFRPNDFFDQSYALGWYLITIDQM